MVTYIELEFIYSSVFAMLFVQFRTEKILNKISDVLSSGLKIAFFQMKGFSNVLNHSLLDLAKVPYYIVHMTPP